jgi:hypothetical protein
LKKLSEYDQREIEDIGRVMRGNQAICSNLQAMLYQGFITEGFLYAFMIEKRLN